MRESAIFERNGSSFWGQDLGNSSKCEAELVEAKTDLCRDEFVCGKFGDCLTA